MDQLHSDGSQSSPNPGSGDGKQEDFIPSDEWKAGRRRRSRRSGSREGGGNRGGRPNSHGRRRGNHTGKMTPRQRAERLMIAACCLLLLALAVLAGFMAGQQSRALFTPSKQTESVEVVQATAGSEAILDEAFFELGAGHPKKALLAFQKIQETQPSLTGLDYLIARAAFQAREFSIAEEALQRSLSRKEMDEEARLLLAVIHLSRSSAGAAQGSQFSDPLTDAESEFRRFSVSHPADSAVYYQWAEALRSRGSYRTAAELLHKGLLRSDLMSSQAFLSAKEILTRLQNEPAKEVPSLSGITSMSGELAIGAALVALQHQQTTEALLFFERAREFYSPSVFRELISDSAFDPYRTDPKMRTFFSSDRVDKSPGTP